MRTVLIAALSCAAASAQAAVATFTLEDGNSRAGIVNRNGMTTWFIDGGRDNVFISNFYARIGAAGPEATLYDLIGVPAATQPAPNMVRFAFTGPGLNALLEWELTGYAAGSARSMIRKSLELSNAGADPLDVAVFDYTDFDIRFNQPAQRDQSVMTSRSRLVTTNADQPLRIVTSVGPQPDGWEISDFFSLYTKFFVDLDGPTTLSSLPAIGTPFPAVAGDNAFAFQWNRRLDPGESARFVQVARFAPVPAPAIAPLLGGALGLLAWRRARRPQR